MNQRDFLYRLLRVLDKNEFETVLSLAMKKGFRIDGFSGGKSLMALPQTYVVNQIVSDNKKAFTNENLFMDVMKGLSLSDNDMAWEAATEWERDTKKAVKILEKLEEDRKSEAILQKKNNHVEIYNKEKGAESASKRIIELKKEIKYLKEQNKNYRKTIQGNKIIIDNLNKNVNVLKKEKASLESTVEQKDLEISDQKEALKIASKKTAEYAHQIEMLQGIAKKYQDLKLQIPQILVFATRQIDAAILSENNAIQIRSWDEETKNNIDWKKSRQLWIVTSDFSYGNRIEIRNTFDDDNNFKKFTSWNALVKELEG